jgi:hypothetical protein
MNYQLKSRSHRLPFLIMFLIGAIALIAQSPATSAHSQGGSPLRLRLKVESNTLRSGEATKIFAEFLNRDYQQVPNDGTRVVEFGLASSGSPQTGSGNVSPQRVTVRPGEWSAAATFVPGQPGKLFIRASSDGLDAAQTLVLITRQQSSSSLLSQLVGNVTYAEPQNEPEIAPKEFPPAPANGKYQLIFQVSFLQAPPPGTVVRISTTLSSGGLMYKGQQIGCAVADIKLDEGQANSDLIGIFSATPGRITVSARVVPNGPKDYAEINFESPQPSRIIFDSDPQSIPSYQQAVPLSVQLADEGGFPIALGADREWRIRLTSAADSALVDFEPQSLVLTRDRPSAQSVLHFKRSPKASEIKLLALDEQNHSLRTGQKIITIQPPIVIAAYWLLLAAVFGGAVGGLARQLHKADRVQRIMPKWTGRYWDLGLIGRISGSVVSGLFLYWTIKLGLARVTLDLGTATVAFFFGGIGGFAGLVVLDRLVEWCFKLLRWSLPWRRRGAVAAHRLAPQAPAAASASVKTP